MSELPDDCVTLTVTSPPYWNAVDYDRHVRDPDQYYRTRTYSVGYEDYEQYLDWYTRISREILRVTRPGGFYAVVIGTVLLNRRHYPVPMDVTARFTRIGWEFLQDIVWHKVTGGVKRAGVFLQRPYPGYFYPNIMTEYIIVFRKPGPPVFAGRRQSERDAAKIPVKRLFTNEIANTVWHIAPVPPGHIPHPCPFPEEIPDRLIQLYSYPGDLVLDPFCGSGQTLKVARRLGRHYVGYDINREYVELSRRRLDEPSGIRDEQLVAVFSKVTADTENDTPKRGSAKTRYGKRRLRAGLPNTPSAAEKSRK
jgi:site-specific DNA-methyltransferase (adenine-specific)